MRDPAAQCVLRPGEWRELLLLSSEGGTRAKGDRLAGPEEEGEPRLTGPLAGRPPPVPVSASFLPSLLTSEHLYCFVSIRNSIDETVECHMVPGRTEKPPKALKAKWFHILLSLADQDLHGTAIMEDVLRRTQGAIRLWPGALYGALEDMSGNGIIQEVDPPAGAPTEGGKRRFYAITQRGRVALAAEVARIEGLLLEARAKGVGEAPMEP